MSYDDIIDSLYIYLILLFDNEDSNCDCIYFIIKIVQKLVQTGIYSKAINSNNLKSLIIHSLKSNNFNASEEFHKFLLCILTQNDFSTTKENEVSFLENSLTIINQSIKSIYFTLIKANNYLKFVQNIKEAINIFKSNSLQPILVNSKLLFYLIKKLIVIKYFYIVIIV